jgi:hypothetical protein
MKVGTAMIAAQLVTFLVMTFSRLPWKAAPLDLHVLRNVGEQLVLQQLDRVVQALHRFEVAIYDVVEQSVQQVADAESGEIGVRVPAFDNGADIQSVILADGDQRPRGDEGGELAAGQPDSSTG